MKITSKFGLTVGDAIRLLRETKHVGVFVGDGPARFYMIVSKPAMMQHLLLQNASDLRPCQLEIGHGLYFGGTASRLHAERVEAARRAK